MQTINENPKRLYFSIFFLRQPESDETYSILEYWVKFDGSKKCLNKIKLTTKDSFKVYWKKNRIYVLIYNKGKPYVSIQIFCKDQNVAEGKPRSKFKQWLWENL